MTTFAPGFARAAVQPGRRWWREARVAALYRWRHGRWPDLAEPKRFTEWVQWRKLYDRSEPRARLTDKRHGKAIAERVLGKDWLIPTVWQGRVLPARPPAPLPLIVKANHGCGQFVVVRSPADWRRARGVAPVWLAAPYGGLLDEWHYQAAERTLLVEPFVGDPAALPIDYKIYVFGGRAAMVQVHQGRGHKHRWAQLDREWNLLSHERCGVEAPRSLERMLGAAERLAAGHDFLRVDFYEIGGRPLFGEYCLFPGSGLDPFDPPELDDWLGEQWAAARLGFATIGC